MPLQRQPYFVPFAGGIDTKNDEKLVPDGQLLELENGVFTKNGSIKKRNGYSALGRYNSNNIQITSGAKLYSYKDELILNTGTQLYSYNSLSDNWSYRGDVTAFSTIKQDIKRDETVAQQTPTSISYNNKLLVTWSNNSTGGRYCLIDTVTKSFIITEAALPAEFNVAGAKIKPVLIGNRAIIVTNNSTELYTAYIDLDTTATSLTSGNSWSSLATITDFDVAEYDSTKAVIVWINDTETLVSFMDKSAKIGYTGGYTETQVAVDTTAPLGVVSDTSNIYVYLNNTVYKFNSSLVAQSNQSFGVTATRVAMIYHSASNNIVIFAENQDGIDNTQITYKKTSISGSVSLDSTVSVRGMYFASSPFIYNNIIYLPISKPLDFQPVICILQMSYYNGSTFTLSVRNVVARILPGKSGAPAAPYATTYFINSTTIISSTEIAIPLLIKTKQVTETTGEFVFHTEGVSVVYVSLNDTNSMNAVTVGQSLLIASAAPSYYDGVFAAEAGFQTFPENISAANAGAGNVANGTYLYALVYEWIDAKGQLHRSAPSIPLSHTVTGGPRAVTVTVPYQRLTTKISTLASSNMVLILYRTIAGGTEVFYRVSSYSAPTQNSVTTASTTTISDTSADATIIANEILYTIGGVLETIAPPSTSILAAGSTRGFLVNAESPTEVWFSQEFLQDIGPEFSDLLTTTVDNQNGNITALGYMDGKLIIFKSNVIYIMAGEGPLRTGEQNSFSRPQLLASDVGCDNPNSIALFDQGLVFKSTKGIYLLGRNLQLQYIGAPIENYNSLIVSGTAVLPTVNEIRFTTTAGTTLVYNYYFNRWSIFTNQPAVHCTVWQDQFCWLKSDGTVYKESTTNQRDAGSFIQLRLVTNWIKASPGLQQFKRFYKFQVIGDFHEHHIFSAKIAYDYSPVWLEQFTINTETQALIPLIGDEDYYGMEPLYGNQFDDAVYQLGTKHLKHQKGQAIKFEFKDLDSGSTDNSFTLTELALEIGQKYGLMKLPAKKVSGG